MNKSSHVKLSGFFLSFSISVSSIHALGWSVEEGPVSSTRANQRCSDEWTPSRERAPRRPLYVHRTRINTRDTRDAFPLSAFSVSPSTTISKNDHHISPTRTPSTQHQRHRSGNTYIFTSFKFVAFFVYSQFF